MGNADMVILVTFFLKYSIEKYTLYQRNTDKCPTLW